MYKIEDIHTVVIAGAGIMGASFAQIFAENGFEVVLYDICEKALEAAQNMITINQKAEIKNNNISKEESEELVKKIHMTMSKEMFISADLVLEAVAEKMEIKHVFWKEISKLVRPDTVLTTNTSGLSISEISTVIQNPERFVGMHWVNPPHLIPLVEVVAGDFTSDKTVDFICSLAEYMHHKPVRVYHDPVGFIMNRLQYAVIREACNCVEKGYAKVDDVDSVMKYGLGMRYACIGPFETMDFGNIETFHNVAKYIYQDLDNEKHVPKLLENVYSEGKLGVKNGAGFYDYSGDKASKALMERDMKFIKISKCLFND